MSRILVLGFALTVATLLAPTEPAYALCYGNPCRDCVQNEFGYVMCYADSFGICGCRPNNIYGYCEGNGSCRSPCFGMPPGCTIADSTSKPDAAAPNCEKALDAVQPAATQRRPTPFLKPSNTAQVFVRVTD